jgi:hypothetical protein
MSPESQDLLLAAMGNRSEPPLCLGDAWVDPWPVVRAFVTALRVAPETKGLDWASDDDLFKRAHALDLESTFKWLEGNGQLDVAIAREDSIEYEWDRIIGDPANRPIVRPRDFVCLMHWAISIDWHMLGAVASKCLSRAPCRGGAAMSLPFEVVAARGSRFTVRTNGSQYAAQFHLGDRVILLSGAPDLNDHLHAYLALHEAAQVGSGCWLLDDVGPEERIEMLPATCSGGTPIGAERLVGASTDSDPAWVVIAADGTFGASINLKGFRAETVAFCHVQMRGMSWPKPGRLIFHKDGRQTLLWTVFKGGELEWRIRLGDATHDLESE